MAEPLRIGTRGSGLALAQTGQVAERLRGLGHEVSIEIISTRGDDRRDVPLHTLGGDGVFVRELERALREHRIDLAVHSLKDLPTAPSAGLDIGCVPNRVCPFDAFVGREGESLVTLPPGAIVGTSSIRRVVQVRAVRPDLDVRPIRGNVDTRLRKFDAGEYRCLILAAAGLERLGLGHRITGLLSPPEFWPAVGQGALALQVRSDDAVTRAAITPLDDPASHAAVIAERACLAELSAGCLAPVGGWGRVEDGGRLILAARVLEEQTGVVRQVTEQAEVSLRDGGPNPVGEGGEKSAAAALGRRVAELLLAAGAGPMLERMRQPLG
jgi:hydroxymethylbilane synthase